MFSSSFLNILKGTVIIKVIILYHNISIQGYCSFAAIYNLANHRDVHCEILESNLSVLLYATPMAVLFCYICHLLPLLVSTSWVLWWEHKTRNQFVLFRKYNKTIVNDISWITTERKIITKKINVAGNSLILGNVCSISCYLYG